MPFFTGAQINAVNGGNFMDVQGDYISVDNSRRTEIKDSYNTSNISVNDSFNNKSMNVNTLSGTPFGSPYSPPSSYQSSPYEAPSGHNRSGMFPPGFPFHTPQGFPHAPMPPHLQASSPSQHFSPHLSPPNSYPPRSPSPSSQHQYAGHQGPSHHSFPQGRDDKAAAATQKAAAASQKAAAAMGAVGTTSRSDPQIWTANSHNVTNTSYTNTGNDYSLTNISGALGPNFNLGQSKRSNNPFHNTSPNDASPSFPPQDINPQTWTANSYNHTTTDYNNANNNYSVTNVTAGQAPAPQAPPQPPPSHPIPSYASAPPDMQRSSAPLQDPYPPQQNPFRAHHQTQETPYNSPQAGDPRAYAQQHAARPVDDARSSRPHIPVQPHSANRSQSAEADVTVKERPEDRRSSSAPQPTANPQNELARPPQSVASAKPQSEERHASPEPISITPIQNGGPSHLPVDSNSQNPTNQSVNNTLAETSSSEAPTQQAATEQHRPQANPLQNLNLAPQTPQQPDVQRQDEVSPQQPQQPEPDPLPDALTNLFDVDQTTGAEQQPPKKKKGFLKKLMHRKEKLPKGQNVSSNTKSG